MMIQPTPPDGAIVLFDGTNLDQWTSVDGGYRSFTPADRRPNWVIEDGVLNVGDNDIMTKESFGDCFVHVEFMVPYMPEETGQARGNSGFYLQSRYEVQILDSYGKEPLDDHDCGAITVAGRAAGERLQATAGVGRPTTSSSGAPERTIPVT